MVDKEAKCLKLIKWNDIQGESWEGEKSIRAKQVCKYIQEKLGNSSIIGAP